MAYKTRQQIADELGISRWTLKRWLDKEHIVLKNRLISPDEADYIYRALQYKPASEGKDSEYPHLREISR